MPESQKVRNIQWKWAILIFLVMVFADLAIVTLSELLIAKIGWRYPENYRIIGFIALEAFIFSIIVVSFMLIPQFRLYQKKRRENDLIYSPALGGTINVFWWILAGVLIPKVIVVEIFHELGLSLSRVEYGVVFYFFLSLLSWQLLGWLCSLRKVELD